MEDAIKFNEWLLKIKNIHVSNSESMAKAFGIVIQNSNDLKNKKDRLMRLQ
jgi:hypothetical protein